MKDKIDKTESQVKIQVQETKEPEKIEQQKPVLTVKERIDKVVDEYEDKKELKKQVFQLVQRILYPEQFCPECDERMFFDASASSYNCPNCGHLSKISNSIPIGRNPSISRSTGIVPPEVEKAIALANESMKETRIPTRPTAIGDKIRKLVADRDAGGPAAPTREDESRVRGSDKNIANKINWV